MPHDAPAQQGRRGWLAYCGPLAPVVAFYLAALGFFFLSRLLLTTWHWHDASSVNDFAWLFAVGVRVDTMILSAALLPAAVVVLLAPRWGANAWRVLVGAYLALLGGVFVFIEASTPTFFSVFGTRPNHVFLEYLNHPTEVAGIITTNYKTELVLGVALTLATLYYIFRASRQLTVPTKPWPYLLRLAALPVVIGFCILGARSSISDSPANLGAAAFSNDNLVNELAQNSSYSVAYFGYRLLAEEQPLSQQYGEMPHVEAIARVRRGMGLSDNAFPDPARPLLHTQTTRVTTARPRNLVIVLDESFTAEYIGTLGGVPVSPRFDALAGEGALFTQLYATGARTNRGIEAVFTGVLPLPLDSIIKMRHAQSDFFTLARVLKERGYATSFVYGGDANFDNMRRFLSYNGVDTIVEQADIANPVFKNHWGVSDEDIFRAADELYRSYGDRPFVSLILTLSNHEPFDFPDGRITLYDQPPTTQANAFKYADYALGHFIDTVRARDYYKDTIFLIVADHGIEVFGKGLIPAAKYRIPALILGPDVPPQRIDTVAAQFDLPTTVLPLLGLDVTHSMPGRDLLHLAPDVAGRAIYQLGTTHAYQVNDQVVLLRPRQAPLQFVLRDGQLLPQPLNVEQAKDALAHLLVPEFLYRERGY